MAPFNQRATRTQDKSLAAARRVKRWKYARMSPGNTSKLILLPPLTLASFAPLRDSILRNSLASAPKMDPRFRKDDPVLAALRLCEIDLLFAAPPRRRAAARPFFINAALRPRFASVFPRSRRGRRRAPMLNQQY